MPLPAKFKVRVYTTGGSAIVVPGGVHPLFGVHILPVQAVAGPDGSPGRVITIDPANLRPLPPGSDADFEIVKPYPVDVFKSR